MSLIVKIPTQQKKKEKQIPRSSETKVINVVLKGSLSETAARVLQKIYPEEVAQQALESLPSVEQIPTQVWYLEEASVFESQHIYDILHNFAMERNGPTGLVVENPSGSEAFYRRWDLTASIPAFRYRSLAAFIQHWGQTREV